MSRLPAVLLSLIFLTPSARAHVGSLNAIFEGFAGKIPVRVIIRPPGVVPGLAQIDVRVMTNGVQKVSVLPVHWRAGVEGAPPPDVCERVDGEPDLYHAELWLMASGAYSVHVDVQTSHGSGKVIVPVNSLATTRLAMSPLLATLLVGLALLLFCLAVSVAGAAVRDSVLEPGATISTGRRWSGRTATAGAALFILLALWGGKSWWDDVDRDYRNNRMFKPVPVTTSVRWEGDRRILRLTVDEAKAGNTWGPLVPDHGKLMHLFLLPEAPASVTESTQAAFAHLHPVRLSSHRFESVLPDVPVGRYRVFADVTHESGFSQTLVSTVAVTSSPANAAASSSSAALEPDPDDSFLGGSLPRKAGDRQCNIGDGLTLVWEDPVNIQFGKPATLRFRVFHADGQPARLEAYMGMLSHLILARDDGAVFTHLHPAGTISMASQQVFQIRAGDKPPKRITPAMMEQLCQPPSPEMLEQPISFPYEFPKPGRYRFWVQVKTGGRVRTAEFEVEIEAGLRGVKFPKQTPD